MTQTTPVSTLELLQKLGTTVMLAKDAKRVTIQQLTTGQWSMSRGTVVGSQTIPDGRPVGTPTLASALQGAADWLAQ